MWHRFSAFWLRSRSGQKSSRGPSCGVGTLLSLHGSLLLASSGSSRLECCLRKDFVMC